MTTILAVSLALASVAVSDASAETPFHAGLPTDPLFGEHGIFALERGDGAEPAAEPNPPGSDCAAVRPLFERYRDGLQNTLEWRQMARTPAWQEVGTAILRGDAQGCKSAADDCAQIAAQRQSGWEALQKERTFQVLQATPDWRDLRSVYADMIRGQCFATQISAPSP